MIGEGYRHNIATRDGLDRAIQVSPPHLKVILEATRDGLVRFAHVAQNTGKFLYPSGQPIVLLIADDYSLSWGPQAFSKTSLRCFLRGASSAIIVSGAPDLGPYTMAVAGAILSGKNALIIESTERWEADWVALLRELAPGMPVLVSTPGPKGLRH